MKENVNENVWFDFIMHLQHETERHDKCITNCMGKGIGNNGCLMKHSNEANEAFKRNGSVFIENAVEKNVFWGRMRIGHRIFHVHVVKKKYGKLRTAKRQFFFFL